MQWHQTIRIKKKINATLKVKNVIFSNGCISKYFIFYLISDFSAEKFVNDLLTHGNTAPCDNTCDAFNNNTDLPTFYDKSLYKW